ncbi:MAG: DUF4239 domain-containing protein, partial [Candidatus Obscuribacterales bacterium]|nr:DUF4239 domain-containing protein [Candidatus Obscuribacterales bacterium]
MELLAYCLLVVLVTVGLSLGGLLISRKFIDIETLKENNPIAEPMLQVIGTLYAVLLGLLVVQSMDRFEEARLNVEKEAVAVADTFRLASALPAPLRDSLQDNCLKYVTAVVEEEWESMEREDSCDTAWEVIDKMWFDVISFNPQSISEQYVYPALLDAAKEMNDYRRSRLVTCRIWVAPILWVVILAGAATTIVFTYSFGIPNLKSQMFMTAMCAVALSLNIYLWSLYNNPFYGLLK